MEIINLSHNNLTYSTFKNNKVHGKGQLYNGNGILMDKCYRSGHCIMSGDDIKTPQENMGHYSAAFTLDRHGHVTPTMRHESTNRMKAYISSLTT